MLQAVQKIILAKQKILMTSLKNLKRILTGEEKILIPSFKILMVSFGILVSSFLIINNTYADESSNLNYSVTVEPALNITTSSNKVSLDLNPLNHDFDSQDLTVSVSTNNETGYKLYVNTEKTTNNPNGNKLIEKDDNSLYIETLSGEVPDDADSFTSNRWGYKLNSSATNFSPFTPGTLVLSSKTIADGKNTDDITTMVFAAKVGYETKAGTYNLALNFQATANPHIPYIQDLTKSMCQELASDNSITVLDARDDNDYQVRYINGNCWMVQNLRYIGDTGSASNSMTIKSATTNIDTDKTISYKNFTTTPYNDSNNAKVQNSGNATNGVWYNYPAVSAGTITSSTGGDALVYDLCPKYWRLPTQDEQTGIIDYSSAFNPVASGAWNDGENTSTQFGFWWSSTIFNSSERQRFTYNSSNGKFTFMHSSLFYGISVRCIRSN